MPEMENAHALVVGIADYKYINPLPAIVLKDSPFINGRNDAESVYFSIEHTVKIQTWRGHV